MTEEERKGILENITKIVEKPIVIEKRKESSDDYVEEEEEDYIAESKSLA